MATGFLMGWRTLVVKQVGEHTMIRRKIVSWMVGVVCCFFVVEEVKAQQAFGRVWGQRHIVRDWQRLYHYPYVYYPQNFWGNEYYRSADDMYYRYPKEMRIPVYNRKWHNYYPQSRRYHSGHHFALDIF